MKILLLSALLLAAPIDPAGGEREKGLQLYAEGRFEAAAAAFRLAIAKDAESAELYYNLALCSWRAGDLASAETAAEKYSALGGNPRVDLHAGLLGAVRFDQAKELERAADAAMQPPSDPDAKPLDPLLITGQALVKAQQAKGHFVRGASKGQSPELLRNLERTLRYIDELEKKIEELKKQREEQQDNEQDNKDAEKSEEDGDQKSENDENKEKGEGEENEQEKGESKPDESETKEGSNDPSAPEPKNQPEGGEEKPGDKPPEPQEQPGESETQESKEEQQPEPQPRNDAPGENVEGRELSPEQTQRLLEQLSELDSKLKALRSRRKSRRPPVERDW